MSNSSKDEIKRLLQEQGVDLDDVTLARLAKVTEGAGSPEEMLQNMLGVLMGGQADPALASELARQMQSFDSAEDFVDSIFIGPCPFCESEQTRNLGEEPGIEDPTVGECGSCKRLFCSECGGALTRAQPQCADPECWLNQEDGDDEEFEEPEL